jgi:hypothetical protein
MHTTWICVVGIRIRETKDRGPIPGHPLQNEARRGILPVVSTELTLVTGVAQDRVEFTRVAQGGGFEDTDTAVPDGDASPCRDVPDVAEFLDAVLSTGTAMGLLGLFAVEDEPFRQHTGSVGLFIGEFKQRGEDAGHGCLRPWSPRIRFSSGCES